MMSDTSGADNTKTIAARNSGMGWSLITIRTIYCRQERRFNAHRQRRQTQ
jgi:hypothetical protein